MSLTYFEILRISEDTDDKQTIMTAYLQAQVYWQTQLSQSPDPDRIALASELLEGKLEDIYQTLLDDGLRKQYRLQLKKQNSGRGRVEVKFSLGGGNKEIRFMIPINPVRVPLQYRGYTIPSVQEFICRAWEDNSFGLNCLRDKTLELWMKYAVGDDDLADIIKFYRIDLEATGLDDALVLVLDALQQRYSVPILPRSPEALSALHSEIPDAKWAIVPSIFVVGVLPRLTFSDYSTTFYIRYWKKHPGSIKVKSSSSAVSIDTTELQDELRFTVKVSHSDVLLESDFHKTVTITSSEYGDITIPVLATRANWQHMAGSIMSVLYQPLGDWIKDQFSDTHKWYYKNVAKTSQANGDLETAETWFWLSGMISDAKSINLSIIRDSYKKHHWTRLISATRRFHGRYGRTKETLAFLVEALRFVGGNHYQLDQHERALEYLASLAYETPNLPGGKLEETNWTIQDDAQIWLNHDDPRSDWISLTERLQLSWSHGDGRADSSKYIGPMPLEVKQRYRIWTSPSGYTFKGPIVASKGVLVCRSADERGVIALDAASGQILWTFSEGMSGGKTAPPITFRDKAFVVDAYGIVYALDVETGKKLWQSPLSDVRDLVMVTDGRFVYVGTGTQVVRLNIETGNVVDETQKNYGPFGIGANPKNLLVTDKSCVFQTSTATELSLWAYDFDQGTYSKVDLPFKLPSAKWTAWDGYVYAPFMKHYKAEWSVVVTNEQTGEKTRENKSAVWYEAEVWMYHCRASNAISKSRPALSANPLIQIIRGTVPNDIINSDRVKFVQVEAASECAVAPVYVESENGNYRIYPWTPDKPMFRLIVGAFGSELHYWLSDDTDVVWLNSRNMPGNDKVNAILLSNVHDIAITSNTISTSLVGNLGTDTGTVSLRDEIGKLVGMPAVYGDVIYVMSENQRIHAVAR